MEEMIFFDNAKSHVVNFFEQEFENFPSLVISHFLNRFNDIMNYSEEGSSIKPKILFTDNIDVVNKAIPKSEILTIFEDSEAVMFNKRLKQILAIIRDDWCLFVDIKPNKISYGIMISYSSIKDKNMLRMLEENYSLKDKQPKVHCIVVRPLNFFSMKLHSISGNELVINLSLDTTKNNIFNKEVREFVDTSFSKLRTTQRKLQDMKNMYYNIFTNVMSYVNGAICVIVDKDYKDNGLFEDGIWLKEPLSFSKLFTQSKCYNEAKLNSFADLFLNMLNFDGITIIDNMGRIRAYNVFVETNSKKVGYVVGGARKRAAFHILSTKKKDIIGVYFQSHEGEVFFQPMLAQTDKKFKQTKPKEIKSKEIQPNIVYKTNETEIKETEKVLKETSVPTVDNKTQTKETIKETAKTKTANEKLVAEKPTVEKPMVQQTKEKVAPTQNTVKEKVAEKHTKETKKRKT